MAHPFSAAPMAFVVSPADGHDDRRWWGGCAWDSFGISAALALDVLIDQELLAAVGLTGEFWRLP
jgi:Alkylmercury lyase